MIKHALFLVAIFLGLMGGSACSPKFKCGRILDADTQDTIIITDLTPIGYNHKDHYLGKMYLQASIFVHKSQFHIGLSLDYPTFQLYPEGMIVYLSFSDGTEMQLTVPWKDLSHSKQGSEKRRQPGQIWYSYLGLPITDEQVAVFEEKKLVSVKYATSTYQVDNRSKKILSRMIKRVRKEMGKRV